MRELTAEKISITDVEADALVNAANEGLREGSGVCGAIFAAAGPELTEACKEIGHCDTGDAVITYAYDADAVYIIHAVGPRAGTPNAAELLRSCYLRAMELADTHGCRSVAFPVISSGVFGYPFREAAEIGIRAVRDYLDSHIDATLDVIFTVPGDSGYAVVCELLGQ